MAQYLTYDEYVGYGGTMDEADFTLAEFKARSRIDRLTMCRVQGMFEVPEEVKMAIMCIIKVDSRYSADAQANNAIVSSYSTDGYSESYGGAGEQTAAVEKALNSQIKQMLFGVTNDEGVPLLYLGLDNAVVSAGSSKYTELKAEIADLRRDMNANIDSLRTDVDNDMTDLRGDIEDNYIGVGKEVVP